MKIVYTGEMDKRLCKEVLSATIEKIVDLAIADGHTDIDYVLARVHEVHENAAEAASDEATDA